MQQKPHTAEWMALPDATKRKLREAFGIRRTGGVQVVANKVVHDGITERDLEAMSIGRMIEYLGEALPWYSPNLCNDLFNLVTAKYEESYDRPESEQRPRQGGEDVGQPASAEVVAKRKGRPRTRPENLPSVA